MSGGALDNRTRLPFSLLRATTPGILLLLGVVVMLALASAGPVSANGGPHGDYVTDGLTDKCAACHRVHQALSNGKLLKATSPYALCLTCHNGAGSRLDVLDGIKLDATAPSQPAGQPFGLGTLPAYSGTLNGGGFEYIAGVTTTSKHNEDPNENQLYPWGYAGVSQGNYAGGDAGNANTGASFMGLTQPLQCTQCHNPHGSPNYRLLKDNLNGNDVRVKAYYSGAWTKDEGGRGFEGTPPADKYVKEYYGSQANNYFVSPFNGSFGLFCGACHTAYPSDGATLGLIAPMTSGGPNTTHYRHRTEMPYTNWEPVANGYGYSLQNPETNPYLAGVTLRLASNGSNDNTIVTCLTCHRAHGTTATVSGWALSKLVDATGLSADQISPAQTSTSRSTLLYVNNRGMCEACHQWRY